MSKPYGAVSGPYWNEVFLIGGGPSLEGFDFELLRGRTLLAVNDAARVLPWATALFSLDAKWIRERREFLQSFKGERYLAPPESDPRDLAGVCYLRRSNDPGLSTSPDTVCLGGTSGYGALNVALLKRASRIILLGYDYSGIVHWFPQYRWAAHGNERYYSDWALKFDSTLLPLRKAGAKVLNVGLGSHIRAFPKTSLAELERRLKDGMDILW